jgi:hypothetical protein
MGRLLMDEPWTREETVEWFLKFKYDTGWTDGFIAGVAISIVILVIIWIMVEVRD